MGCARWPTLAGEAQQALPRLARLERTSGPARVSMGGLLEERTRNTPDDFFFVFDDRGHTYADAGVRVDNVVRGLLSIGVRPGEHVGVLMNTRPSALTAITALNRIGAVAVMLRPDGATAREAELGDVRRIIADPEHATAARDARRVSVYVLGGGPGPRRLGPGITDLERITPALVQVPDWYVPNPGKASNLAFLLFTGEGETTRCLPVTNGQWARSAYGTATAARLSAADTVYSVTPLHHAAGLLTSVGGALAGGSRLALTTSYDPVTFWAEVRRYGVTVVSYTWTLLGDLIEADRAPGERHHPVRLFVGSGMPAWLWQRALDRFPSAAVLEFFVSSSEDVVLANISGRKVGAKGRPIPASAEVAVAACDLATGEVRRDYDGLGRACGTDEVGLLIARTSSRDARRAARRARGRGRLGLHRACLPPRRRRRPLAGRRRSRTWCIRPEGWSRPARPRTPWASWTRSSWSLPTASGRTRTVTPGPPPRPPRNCTPRSRCGPAGLWTPPRSPRRCPGCRRCSNPPWCGCSRRFR